MVVDSHAIVYPRAMAVSISIRVKMMGSKYLLVMFGYTAIAPLAMFASQWLSYHTRHAKVLVVKFPETQKLIDYCFLLSEARELRYVSWFINHGTEVEVSAKAVKHEEEQIGEEVCRVGSWSGSVIAIRTV